MSDNKVLHYFRKICAIPHGSGNEAALGGYITSFAEKRGLSARRDEAGNVLVRKPGRGAEPVIVQSHIDMVCEKNSDKKHDFLRDPIEVIEENGFLRANDTTLGADNGIGAAYALALLDGAYAHPPLEAVFTTNEEVGMEGAAAFDASVLTGRRLLNLDEGTEGVLIASCAGGARADMTLPVETEPAEAGRRAALIEVKGLLGGHSGIMIREQRANANALLGRLLAELTRSYDLRLYELSGGMKDNAIPREARAVITVREADFSAVGAAAAAFEAEARREYRAVDSGISVIYGETIINEETPRVLTRESLKRTLAAINLTPNGPLFYSADIKGLSLVETSSNLGVIEFSGDTVVLRSALRSSVAPRKRGLITKFESLAEAVGAKIDLRGDYPEWEYREKSPLRELAAKIFTEAYGREPVVSAVHAGLEPGVFISKIPGLDAVAFGPNIYGEHTPGERAEISSVLRVWEYLLALLKNM
ncbi:MAG: aminoacyl-histidine dipeptidase [Clostridiales bacterium]|jgi:dipeptidase D|nr:aminoacyl-histidine dipeptidase [Clostridiales bacterium]